MCMFQLNTFVVYGRKQNEQISVSEIHELSIFLNCNVYIITMLATYISGYFTL